MKKTILALATCFGLATAGGGWAMTLAFAPPSPAAIPPGGTTSLGVFLSGAPANLASFTFDLGYDSAVLSFDPFSGSFSMPFDGSQDGSLPGVVSVFANASGPLPSAPDPLPVGTLAFIGVAPGSSAWSLSGFSAQVSLVDLSGNPFLEDYTGPIQLLAPAEVTVVPQPQSLLLLGSGLLGLLARRRFDPPLS